MVTAPFRSDESSLQTGGGVLRSPDSGQHPHLVRADMRFFALSFIGVFDAHLFDRQIRRVSARQAAFPP
jgi:hypothetical protein